MIKNVTKEIEVEVECCDKCGKELKDKYYDYVGLTLKGRSEIRDPYGLGPGAGHDVSFKFCNRCRDSFFQWIKR